MVLIGIMVIQPWIALVLKPSSEWVRSMLPRYAIVLTNYVMFLVAVTFTITIGQSTPASNIYCIIISLNSTIFINALICEPIRAIFVQLIAEKAYKKESGLLKFLANEEAVVLFRDLDILREATYFVINIQNK